MYDTCVLNSGGMDSFLAWSLESQKASWPAAPHNVFVNIGHNYAAREREALLSLAHHNARFQWIEVEGPRIGQLETPSGIIPNRNAELILAASTAGYSNIMLGILHGEINSDKAPEFLGAMQTMLDITWRQQYWNAAPRLHRVWSPIRHLTKTELVAAYGKSGGSVHALLATVSCYAGTELHCGQCASCFKRWVALANNGVTQPWEEHPLTWDEVSSIQRKAQDGTYDARRAAEVNAAFASEEARRILG